MVSHSEVHKGLKTFKKDMIVKASLFFWLNAIVIIVWNRINMCFLLPNAIVSSPNQMMADSYKHSHLYPNS